MVRRIQMHTEAASTASASIATEYAQAASIALQSMLNLFNATEAAQAFELQMKAAVGACTLIRVCASAESEYHCYIVCYAEHVALGAICWSETCRMLSVSGKKVSRAGIPVVAYLHRFA